MKSTSTIVAKGLLLTDVHPFLAALALYGFSIERSLPGKRISHFADLLPPGGVTANTASACPSQQAIMDHSRIHCVTHLSMPIPTNIGITLISKPHGTRLENVVVDCLPLGGVDLA